MTTPKSAIEKGKRFVKHLKAVLREQLDSKAYDVSGSGNGLDKNDLRLPNFNCEIEAKNANQVNLIADWEQAKRQKTQGNLQILAIRNPKKPEFAETLVVMDLGDWIELMRKQNTEVKVTSNFSPNLKWLVEKAVAANKNLLKELTN